jgi:hypothetical protein
MITKKIQRKYPDADWDYKAISTIINDNGIKREIVYYTNVSKSKKREGVEMFTGPNYIVNSGGKSSSRSYDIKSIPVKYQDVVKNLKSIYSKTKWSTARFVNEN